MSYEPACCAINVPDEFIYCIGKFHCVAWLNIVHRTENGRLNRWIIGRLAISILKSVAPQNVATPDDEVTFAPSFAPH